MNKKIEEFEVNWLHLIPNIDNVKEGETAPIKVKFQKELRDLITSAVEEAQKKQMEVDSVYKNQCVEAETERCANKSKEKAQEMSSSKGRGQDEATMIYVIGREIAKAIRGQ